MDAVGNLIRGGTASSRKVSAGRTMSRHWNQIKHLRIASKTQNHSWVG